MGALLSSSQIDAAVESFENIITEANNLSISRKGVRFGTLELSSEAISLIRRRRACDRRWRRARDPCHRLEARSLARQVEATLEDVVNTRLSQTVARLDREPGPFRKKFWRLVKNLKRRSTAIPPIRTQQGTLVTPAEKCEAFASHLASIPDVGITRGRSRAFEDRVRSSPNAIDGLDQSVEIPQISLSALKISIACLKSNKAPEVDCVGNSHLKHLPDMALRSLLFIFNPCLQIGYFPNRWKESIVSCTCKPGKPKDRVSSYRMISLLPCPGKLFECQILDLINVHLDDNDSIISQQFGFRKGKSCTHQLYRVVKIIRSRLQRCCHST